MSVLFSQLCYKYFFFNDTATTEIYTLSLHDALPIWTEILRGDRGDEDRPVRGHLGPERRGGRRSEEHTSELQSPCNIVCRLLLEKKTWEVPHSSKARRLSAAQSSSRSDDVLFFFF